MKEIIWKPELHRFRSCKEFVEEFRLGASDLILTNEYIYQPYFGAMNLECAVLYQEQYGIAHRRDGGGHPAGCGRHGLQPGCRHRRRHGHRHRQGAGGGRRGEH